MEFEGVDEILDFAIGKEEEAAHMYTDLAEQMANKAMGDVFREFAQEELGHKQKEELGHKQKLLRIKEGKELLLAPEYIANLGIADYAVEVEPSSAMGYQQALMLAMKEEKAAFRMYTQLAAATDNQDLRTTLLRLAEEAKHKLRFEIEYDEIVLAED